MTQVRDRKGVNTANKNEMWPEQMDSSYVCSLAVLGGVCVCEDYTERWPSISAVTIAY